MNPNPTMVAFDCGPVLDSCGPSLVLAAFLEGARQQGANVEAHRVADLGLEMDRGDLGSWLDAIPGAAADDAMHELLPRLRAAQTWVFATPVHCCGMSTLMHNLLSRMRALISPQLETRQGRTRSTIDYPGSGAIILVASAKAWEVEAFDPVLGQLNEFCVETGRTLTGVLLRPHSLVLTRLIDTGMPVDDVFQAAFDAGREAAMHGFVSREKSVVVSRQLLPREIYMQFVNQRVPQKLRSIAKSMAETQA